MGFLSKYLGHDRDANVKNLTGDPKKAIIFLAVPAFFSLLVLNLNGIIDGFWVAGLGKNELDATAFVAPIYGTIIAIGNGIGIGAAAVIARAVAKNDKEHADMVGGQVLMISIIGSVITMVVMLLCYKEIFTMMGGDKITSECEQYVLPLIIGSPLIIVNGVVAGMLRGEGDGRRSLLFLASTVLFNMIFDPFFIFIMGWGLVGAAIAIVVSAFLSLVIAYSWYYRKKDTFVCPVFVNMTKNKTIRREILIISLPQTVELVSMAIFDIFTDASVNSVGGADSVAVWTTMWRVLTLLMIPAQALASALIPVASSAIAQRDENKLRDSTNYSLKLAIIIMLVAMVLIWLLADYLVLAFSWSKSTADLNGPMAHAVRVGALAVPFIPLTFIGSAMLQVTGKGFYAATISISRNIMHLVIFALGAVNIALVEACAIWDKMDYFWFTFVIDMIVFSLLMYYVARRNYKRFTRTMPCPEA